MARKPTGNRPGPENKPINWENFESLCGFQCTLKEMAGFFKVSQSTLIRRVKEQYGEEFESVYTKYSSTGLCSVRRYQFALARTNAAMAIHLGRVYLNQKEIIVNENHNTITQKAILSLPDNGHREVVHDSES